MLDQSKTRKDYFEGAKHIVIGALVSDFNNVMSYIPTEQRDKVIYIKNLREYQMLTACQNVFLDGLERENRQYDKETFYLKNNTVLHVRDFSRF